MNIGYVTSFIIAGILMISILSMNTSISHSSTELTIEQITQRKANTIGEILEHDITNIAFSPDSAIAHSIKDAQKNKIEFESDIDRDGTVETVIWTYTNNEASSSQNPNDYILTRNVNGDVTQFSSGVTDFNITYLDSKRNEVSINLLSTLLGNEQSERDKIRHIKINFTIQSTEKIGGADNIKANYLETTWNKQFTPINLSL
jgi:hypothetical protein